MDKEVTKGTICVMGITGTNHEGEGVGRLGELRVFVPSTVPGDEVRVEIDEVKSNYARGRVKEILKPSPDRVEPRCGVFEECGGCVWQAVSYEAQLNYKSDQVVQALSRIGGIKNPPVAPIIGAPVPWNYRNKVQFPVGGRRGRLKAGCFARGTHEIVDVAECFIQHQVNNRVIAAVKKIMEEMKIEPYDEYTGKGLLRHIMARVAHNTGEAMVVLVTSSPYLPSRKAIVRRLFEEIPGLVSVVQNINSRKTNVILGPETKVIGGRGYIEDVLDGLRFHISPISFYQVNTPQAEVLYRKVVEYANPGPQSQVLDVYCGIGTISLFLARKAGFVLGVEEVPRAVADARKNAALNGFFNVDFVAGSAERVLPGLLDHGLVPEVVVVDPPRQGCKESVLSAIVAMRPGRIVYVSCNPATLARDLKTLVEYGYSLSEVQPIDMFPQTAHVECVVLMSRL